MLKIYETRLVRVPFSYFYAYDTMAGRSSAIEEYAQKLSGRFGPNWKRIGPSYKDDIINECVELKFQRIYEVPE